MNKALTTRETEVLKLVAMGQTSRKIGEQLAISVRTVEGHRLRVMMKIGASNLHEVVRYALQKRLIEP